MEVHGKLSFIDYLNNDMKIHEISKVNNSVTFTNKSCDTIQMFTTGDRKEAIAND